MCHKVFEKKKNQIQVSQKKKQNTNPAVNFVATLNSQRCK